MPAFVIRGVGNVAGTKPESISLSEGVLQPVEKATKGFVVGHTS